MPHTFRAMICVTVTLVVLVLAPAIAEACKCSLISPQELVNEADVVFKGTVVAIERVGPYSSGRKMTFEVERVWKGASAKRLEVLGEWCGPWHEVGERRIVFARREAFILVGDGCASDNYELGLRSRSAYDGLLPGHETISERELRLKQAAEMEELYGRARTLIRTGTAVEAEKLLSDTKEHHYFNREGFQLWIEVYIAAERERWAARNLPVR